MAQNRFFGWRPPLPTRKKGVRHLSPYEPPRHCEWPACPQRATSQAGSQSYCPEHFFKAMQKQWEG